ncbi:MAG TPA: aminotransferase class I/II-fold pyridoxal phosphate-dependent enzyme [Acidobacteriota bacterium]|nr:aminotransferase class I/II-fold pyridoxal phosphate-dependent enzyme [Acidobacteriota bacterium]
MPIAVPRKIFLDRADRLQRMPVPAADLARSAERLRRRGVEVIDLSCLAASSPAGDMPGAAEAAPNDWRPATDAEMESLAEATADWYDRRFGVRLDPKREIGFAPNTTMALHLLANAFIDAGELALLPDPGAPFYRGAVVLCGGGVIPYHLLERNDYLPSFPMLEAGLVGRVRLLVLGYPHNPTATAADLSTMTQAVAFARKHNILIAFDGAFSFTTQGAFRPRTLLQATGAKGVGVEMSDLGTNFGYSQFPLTVIGGNREAISAVTFLVEGAHLRPSRRTVRLAQHLLTQGEALLDERARRLDVTRRLLMETTAQLGWNPRSSPTAPFLWIRVPAAAGVAAFCRRMLRRTGILMIPGTIFGERGEGYVRLVLPDDPQLAQATADRLRQHAKRYQRRLPRPPAGRTRRRTGRKPATES